MLCSLAANATRTGWLVLDGRAAEFERDVPFGVLVDAVDAHLTGLDRGRVQRLEPDLLGQLAAVFPALEDHGAGAPAIVAGERFRLHRTVRSLLPAGPSSSRRSPPRWPPRASSRTAAGSSPRSSSARAATRSRRAIELVTAYATVENLLGRHADAHARLTAALGTPDRTR